jgi:hypothetical protein
VLKSIKLGFFTTLEFEDSDPDYACMRKLMAFRDEKVIGKTDFDIICSMFELHEKLPPVAKVLYDNGFILPENEIVPDYSHYALWKYERQNEPPKTLTYSDKYHETPNHQSDSYYKNAEYTVGDLVAKCEYSVLMSDYGKIKKNHKLCTVAVKGKVILENRADYETSG